MLKYVTPSLAGARIPDPSRGRDLPATGDVVEYSTYWMIRLLRGEVTVRDVLPGDGASSGTGTAPPAALQLTDVLTARRESGGGFEASIADLATLLAPIIAGLLGAPSPVTPSLGLTADFTSSDNTPLIAALVA